MTWVKRCNPAAILYVWHGGQEGGNGAADVLTGRVNPCGKLPDTIAEQLSDYPANANFGNAERNFYAEDIFRGYRYFETFAPEKVLYPFGFGLSYTAFSIEMTDFHETADAVDMTIRCQDPAPAERAQAGVQAREQARLLQAYRLRSRLDWQTAG